MKKFEERIHQELAIQQSIAYLESDGKVLLQAPTGAGKTYIASRVCDRFRGKKILFVVNRQALVSQSWDTFSFTELDRSVMHNEIRRHTDGELYCRDHNNANVVITMIETFWNEFDGTFEPDLIVLDEAHKATSSAYQKLKEEFPNAMIFGLTATPARMKNEEGESLREWYGDNLVSTISLGELIEQGYLAKPEYIQYNENNHVVRDWLKYTDSEENRRTIIFCEDTKHMMRVSEAFESAGISSRMITTTDEHDGITVLTPNQRNTIFKHFRDGLIEVLITVNALCEGFDEALAKYCVLLRNVRSIPLYHQMVGRVLRQHVSKPKGFVVDYYTNIERMGYVEDYEWDLDNDAKQHIKLGLGNHITVKQYERYRKVYVTCECCNHVFDIKQLSNCSHCGTKSSVKRKVLIQDVRDMLYGAMDAKIVNDFEKAWGNKAFNKIIEKIAFARDRKVGPQFNKIAKIDLFVDKENFSCDYEVLNHVIVKTSWKITDSFYY